jgi:hypothetical protein
MARYVDKSTLDARAAELRASRQVRDQVHRSFGWRLESVRFPPGGGSVCFVQVQLGACRTVELIFENGLLPGIPPLKRWRR